MNPPTNCTKNPTAPENSGTSSPVPSPPTSPSPPTTGENPPRLNPHETAASYLAVPTALLAYRYETTATNAIWIAAVLAWAVCAYVSNQNEDS